MRRGSVATARCASTRDSAPTGKKGELMCVDVRSVSCLKLWLALLVGVLSFSMPAEADSAAKMQREARAGLQELYRTTPAAQMISEHAVAVLVFPEIIKGGFLVAAQYGDGVLFKGDTVGGYYNTSAASFGLQAGAQEFGYALFFMGNKDLAYLDSSSGWEVGSAPSITVVDKGYATSMSTTTLRDGVYAFFFGQRGLMAGLSLQGTKITKITPD